MGINLLTATTSLMVLAVISMAFMIFISFMVANLAQQTKNQ
jgi:hypothetical protein